MNSWDLKTRELEPHRPEVLLSHDGETRGIATVLPAGDEWQEHETRESAWIVVVDGELEVQGEAGTQKAGPGHVLHFEAHERREVRARTDARFLMVLAPWPAPDHIT